MDGMKYGAGLTMEQRLARLEQMLGGGIPAPTTNGSVLTVDSTHKPVWVRNAAAGYFVCPASTGTYSVSGLGFRPRIVRFAVSMSNDARYSASMQGVATDNGQWATSAVVDANTPRARTDGRADSCVYLRDPHAAGTITWIRAAMSSFDADGFTLNFLNVNTVFTIFWEAA